MRYNPNDESDEFNDDLNDDGDALSFEMTEEFTRFIGDRWRAQQDSKPISASVSLASAVHRMPAQWLDAACAMHRINLRGEARSSRRAKADALFSRLTSMDHLARCVLDMPPYARAALRRVLESGGSMRLSALVRDFGDMTGDGWFWDEQPPKSSLGELRRRALLFVGKSSLSKTSTATTRRTFKIAVVPSELREPLGRILGDPAVRREEESALATYFASSDDLLKEAFDGVQSHYVAAPWEPVLAREYLEVFLKQSADAGFNPLLVWTSLQTVLEFFDTYAHELIVPGDLAGYHVSEMATEFVDRQYLQRWALDERRELIETVRRLYTYLHTIGVIDAEAIEDIDQSCRQLITGKRRLHLIHRPPPLGGELLLARVNPNSGEEERFTINHQRLIMVWFAEFHQDWRTLRKRCAEVPAGKDKARLVDDLIGLEPSVCELLVARVEDDDINAAVHWFYEDTVIELSAW